jgi:hypothetical protein
MKPSSAIEDKGEVEEKKRDGNELQSKLIELFDLQKLIAT